MEIARVKEGLGMDRLSCLECEDAENDTDGEYGEIDNGWICWNEKRRHVANLKSFPFKTDQKCCCPRFWRTKFANLIKGRDIEDRRAYNQFLIALWGLGLWEAES